ncbi:hypothetical protein NKR23_g6071 [Pleurostoma richardsiae]|uniref:Uncharacterized protein n=1 Tax=Pleurostoma richardsiae TaxID=41990 RepID=A0AA38VEG4_9PEZI|nr:hypothetical protein NKR23_g6071 [Pleurostoma richardsiae]
MVDQLWMWIIGEDTLVTCFPGHLGAEIDRDASDAYIRIRTRLKCSNLESVFELVLVVLEETLMGLWDRSTAKGKPDVMMIFRQAVGNLADRQEGELQSEINDIIQELEIMIAITSDQLKVLAQFKGKVEQKSELEGLKTAAQSTSQRITDLLAFKQQQAISVQARQTVQQGEEAVRQARSLPIFTFVTILFLPLSFVSSVFGMNNAQFGANWSLGDQFILMFPISFGIIIMTGYLGFS